MKKYIRSDSSDLDSFNKYWDGLNKSGFPKWQPYIKQIERGTSGCLFDISVIDTIWDDDKPNKKFEVNAMYDGKKYGVATIIVYENGAMRVFFGAHEHRINSIDDGIQTIIKYLKQVNDYIIEDQKRRRTNKKSRNTFLLCENCIDEIRSRGEKVRIYKGRIPEDMLHEPTPDEIREYGFSEYDLVGQCVWCEDMYIEDELRRASF